MNNGRQFSILHHPCCRYPCTENRFLDHLLQHEGTGASGCSTAGCSTASAESTTTTRAVQRKLSKCSNVQL